ncbi:MAG: T9SS type A sorting domain-containing protein [Taibaiella sp.]|nr:T9SS type A sorting domain-containing protein [Taibaiella sp.]
MKKGFLLLPIIAGIAYISLTSYSSGYTANASGSGSATGCGGSGCHGTSATTGIIDSVYLDSAGMGVFVNKYTPGKSYIIHFGAANTTTNNLPKFGFQLSVVNAAGTANAGTLSAITSTSLNTSGIIHFIGQTTPLAPLFGTGGIGTAYRVDIPWVAPAAGTGSVKIYGVINAVSGNGSEGPEDKWNAKSATITERTTTPPASVNDVESGLQISAFPNPCVSNMHLQLINASGTYNVTVSDMSGKVVLSQVTEANGTTVAAINMSQLAGGVYHVAVSQGGTVKIATVTKQ